MRQISNTREDAATFADLYSNQPNATRPEGTIQHAANAITGQGKQLRHVASSALGRLGKAAVRQAIATTDLSRNTLRSRFSELRNMVFIEPTEERLRNPSGRSASVLRLTTKGRVVIRGLV